MFLSSRHEMYVFFATFSGGIVVGLIFDLFRILRKNFKGASRLVWLQDILMWLLALGVVYTTIFIANSARVRWYELIGFVFGFVFYILMISPFVVKMASKVITAIKKVLLAIFAVISYPFKIIFRFLRFVFSPIASHFKKITSATRNILTNTLNRMRLFVKKF